MSMSIYDTLNEQQREAVFHTEGPVLILAGAGSGKTRVLTHRTAYLIEEKGVNPYNIMAITFTNKAAGEMRERIDQLVGYGSESIWVSTFHSTCVRILRRHIDRIGFDTNFTIYDSDDQKTLMKDICKRLNVDTKIYKERSLLLVSFDLDKPDLKQLQRMVGDSVKVKERIVEQDPHEQGIRKALNLGHTFGHAFESWALKRKPILHGYAVAFGLIPELYLSVAKTGFPTEKMRQTVNFIKEFYGTLDITCDDYDELIELMHHDKKNQNGIINFTMLGGIGDIRINQTATTEEIKEALDFFREG